MFDIQTSILNFTFRNDADVVGVRHGCTFTGFTGGSFDGDSFSLSAGNTDRSIFVEMCKVFASPVRTTFDAERTKNDTPHCKSTASLFGSSLDFL